MRRSRRIAGMLIAGVVAVATATACSDGGEVETDVDGVDAATAGQLEDGDVDERVDGTGETAFDHLAELPVSDGLVVGFLADAGVEADDQGRVISWTDLTGTLTLEPSEDEPRLIEAGRNGHDTIRLEGTARGMSAPGVDGLPTGNTDRTVILAGNFGSEGAGSTSHLARLQGVGWGDPQTAGTNFYTGNVHYNCFGLNAAGIATGLGEGGSACYGQIVDDFRLGDVSVRDPEFISVAARTSGGQLDLLYRDRIDKSSDRTFETQSLRFWIGGWPTAPGVDTLDVVAALVYDRALDDEEVTEIVDHLRDEYGVDS